MEANDSQVWEVEAIKYDKQVKGKGTYYFVKWKGYDDEENTWEPTSHLPDAKRMVDEYAASKREAEALHKKDMEQRIAEQKAEQLAATEAREASNAAAKEANLAMVSGTALYGACGT